MSLGQYLLSVVLLIAALAPLAFGARALRRMLMPRWSGAPAWLADAVIALALFVAVTELLGTIGAFKQVPIVIGCAAAGLGAVLLTRRVPGRPGLEPPPAPAPTGRYVAVAAVAVLVADWSARVADALAGGMVSADTLWYHLPQAARFVQDGSITGIHFFDSVPLTAYYPATASLFHAVGIAIFERDVLSPLLNMAWLGLACLAGWCVGRSWGVGPATLVGVCVVLGTPIMSATQPGQAYSDVAGLALFLSAIALIVNARGQTAPTVLAGVAAGLALGVKLTLVAPVAALTLGVVWLALRHRDRRVLIGWFAAIVAAGGYWYFRNIIQVGNPFPPAELDLGPISLPHAPVSTPSFALAEYVTDIDHWRETFLPGLLQAFGPVWWATLAVAGAGLLLALLRPNPPTVRLLGGVGLVCALAFLLQPQALGVEGNPFLFVNNLRYATLGLVVGLVVLPIVAPLVRAQRRWWVLGAFGAILLATQLDPSVWPTELRDDPFEAPVRGRPVLAGLAAGVLVLVVAGVGVGHAPRVRARPALVWGAVGAVAIGAGWFISDDYLKDRYARSIPLPATYRWVQGLHDERIGLVGVFLQYPFYGEDLSNHVQYVGLEGEHGSYSGARTCREWRRAVDEGGYDYVVTAPPGFPAPFGRRPEGLEALWTRAAPAATEVFHEDAVGNSRVAVIRIRGKLDPDACGQP